MFISKASEDTKQKLYLLIKKYDINIINVGSDADRLADIYVEEGVIPKKYREDGVHIATASIANMDIILSWNFKHIVKRKTIIMTGVINNREGYNNIDIYSPTEVIENDEE